MPAPPLSLKARALKYLAQREHSRAELKRKLQRYTNLEDNLEAMLNSLECGGWLSEVRFSEVLLRQRATRYGNVRIYAELRQHGIEISDQELAATGDEVLRAQTVLRKKFDNPAKNMEERAKQIRFLQQRGFSSPTIRKVVSEQDD